MHSKPPEPRQPLPADRSYDSVWHHFQVERAIAERLKAADRSGRKQIYASMYDELFAQVPDHPRLTRRDNAALTDRANLSKTRLVNPFAVSDSVFLEFGSGDCCFSFAMAERFRHVYAVDIADQISPGVQRPKNFSLVVYDGYNLDLPEDSVDLAFSDQLIEHLHPDDAEHHFRLVHRVLKPGGLYLLRTPHRLTGPHDVSRYFSAEAQCFHLKEWTYSELAATLADLGFDSVRAYWFGRGVLLRLPLLWFRLLEQLPRAAGSRLPARLARLLLPSVTVAVRKRSTAE